jgi:transposase-like protein
MHATGPSKTHMLVGLGRSPVSVMSNKQHQNNIVERDYRTVKRHTWLAKGYGHFRQLCRTLGGIEAMMIRKGRARRVKGDAMVR